MNEQVQRELDALSIKLQADKKLLTAEAVLDFAERNTDSALYAEFEWNKEEAARRYRLSQARKIIRCYVYFEPQVTRRVRAYVSVPTDRVTTGGYRPMSQVLSNGALIQQLVDEVAQKIRSMRGSYAHLQCLDPLWSRLDQVVTDFLAEMRPRATA